MRVALSSTGRCAVRVHVALAAQVLATAALVVFEVTRGDPLAARIAALGGDPRAPGAEEIVGELTVFALLVLAVAATWIAAAAAYLAWLGEVSGRAVRAWLIPGVNLVAPPFALHAAWAAAGPAQGRRRPWLVLLVAWWVSWLATIVVTLLSLFLRDAGLTGLGPIAAAVTALAAALCAATVHELTYGPARRRGARLFLTPLRRPAGGTAPAAAAAAQPAAEPAAVPVTGQVSGQGEGRGRATGG